MTWTDPGVPLWALLVGLLALTNGFGLLVSMAIERWGLPAGWSIQEAKRKPGQLRRHLPLIAANFVTLEVLGGTAFALFSDMFHFARPGFVESVVVLGILVLFDDFGFYWIHRLLHVNKTLYRKVHKIHHRGFAPVPIEYFYAHPAEWMTGSMAPVVAIVGLILVSGSLNAWLLLAWVLFRQVHELDIHSGLKSPLGDWIPLWGNTLHHDQHHAKPNHGNYASTLYFWDLVFGTRIALPSVPERETA